MKKIGELKIGTRISFIFSAAICLILIGFGVFVVRSERQSIESDTDTRLYEQVNDLASLIENQIKENQKKVENYGNMAFDLLEGSGELAINQERTLSVAAVNQNDNYTMNVTLPALLLNNGELYHNYGFVDKIGNLTKATNTIFQKFNGGYLRVSTNIRNSSGERAVDTYIPSSSEVAATLDRGETYMGRAIILNEWYLTFYKPLIVNGEIVGAYYLGLPEKNIAELKALFNSKVYYTRGYPYVVDRDGNFIIHPTQEGGNINSESFFQQILKEKKGKTKYQWQGETKIQYFRDITGTDLFVATTIYESDLLDIIQKSRTAAIIAIVLGVFIAFLIGTLLGRNIQGIIRSLNLQIKEIIDAVLNGDLNKRADEHKTNWEFRDITVGLNKTIEAFIDPILVSGDYIDKIGKGIIPEKLTADYKGDFEKIKDNINQCIDGMQGLVEGNRILQKMAVNDHTEKVEGSYLGIYADVATAINMVRERLLHVIDISQRISEGDLSDREDLIKTGKRSENDRLMPAFIRMEEALNNLIIDINNLAGAAVDGKLSTRADITKHQGDYVKVVNGINNTLDAVINPLTVAADYVSRISVGDMPPVITDKYNGDFNIIINNINILIKALNEVIDKARLMANGDLTVDLKKRSDNDELMQSLNDMVKSTATIIAEFQTASNNISASSQQMSSTSQQMSQGASEQASSAEEVSSSMEEMAANIQQNTENAQETEKIALNAANNINMIAQEARGSVDSMKEIAEKVSIIGEIARQTNILALNAAVEAARAGEHGKGFAVVAAEVRKLAERSQVAAVEIDTLTKDNVRSTERAGEMLTGIAPEIQKTAKLVQEIAAASIEQNSGADQVNNAIQQLNQVTQQNAAASEEMATSSEELASQAQQLMEMISFFKIDSDKQPSKEKGKSFRSDFKNESTYVDKDPKSAVRPAAKNVKGVSINMGRDNLDSNYESF